MKLFKSMYILSWVAFIVSALLVLFVIVFSGLGFVEYYQQVDVPFTEVRTSDEIGGEAIAIDLPLTGISLMFPPDGFIYIYVLLLFVSFGVYVYLMMNFFKSFINPKVFDIAGLKYTRRFYRMNILIFVFFTLLSVWDIFRIHDAFFDEEFFYSLIFLGVGVLVYYYYSLMKKGIEIQEENDLTI